MRSGGNLNFTVPLTKAIPRMPQRNRCRLLPVVALQGTAASDVSSGGWGVAFNLN